MCPGGYGYESARARACVRVRAVVVCVPAHSAVRVCLREFFLCLRDRNGPGGVWKIECACVCVCVCVCNMILIRV